MKFLPPMMPVVLHDAKPPGSIMEEMPPRGERKSVGLNRKIRWESLFFVVAKPRSPRGKFNKDHATDRPRGEDYGTSGTFQTAVFADRTVTTLIVEPLPLYVRFIRRSNCFLCGRRSDTLSMLDFVKITVKSQLALYNATLLVWREKVCINIGIENEPCSLFTCCRTAGHGALTRDAGRERYGRYGQTTVVVLSCSPHPAFIFICVFFAHRCAKMPRVPLQ